jgi:replication factor A1
MSASSISTTAAQLADQFADADAAIDVDEGDLEADLETLVDDYCVPIDEAERTVQNRYLDQAGLERDVLFEGSGNETVELADIEEAEAWVDVEVQVAELWEDTHESMAQAGLLGDESGTIKFISWEASDLPLLQEGESYRLESVVTDEYEGRYSVKLVSTSEIRRLDEDVEVGEDALAMTGALVDIKTGSGLIKRCPDEGCTRVLQNGRCSEHGEGDGEFDLRIKGVLDDGTQTQDVLMDAEATEALTGVGLEAAKEMAMDALDTEVVVQQFEEDLVGEYYRVEGPAYGQYLLADEMDAITEYDRTDVEELLIEARSRTVDVADAGDRTDGSRPSDTATSNADRNSTAGSDSIADSNNNADSTSTGDSTAADDTAEDAPEAA